MKRFITTFTILTLITVLARALGVARKTNL